MDRCDACDFVYADLPTAEVAARMRTFPAAYRDRLTSHDLTAVRTRPDPGTWSALEYACHVRDVFEVQNERARLALTDDTPTFVPMGRDERAVDRRYNDQDPIAVAAELEAAARALARTFDGLDAKGWERTGIYNWPTPTERDLAWLARHTVHEGLHHLRDVDAGLR